MRGVKYPTLGMMLFCVSQPGMSAVETGITAGVSAEWSDNVFLTSSDRRNDWVESLDLGANLEDQETYYQYGLDYTISHERYERDSFDEVTNYNGTANLNLAPFPRRFEWNNSIQSEVTRRSSVGLNTPDNRDQRNVYTTSPSLALILLPRDQVRLIGNAEKVTFREADSSDSDRAGANVDWTHSVSSLLDLSLNVSQEKVQFDQDEDYQSTDYHLGINRRINGGNIRLALGHVKVEPEFSEETSDPQYQADIDWSNRLHSVFFQAYHDITDSSIGASSFFEPDTQFETPNDVNTDEVTIVRRTRYTVGYTYGSEGSYAISPSIYVDDEEAVDDSSDTLRKGFALLMSRNLSVETRAYFAFNYARDDTKDFQPVQTQQVDYTRNYRLGLDKSFTEGLAAQFWITREDSNREGDDEDYEVHTVGASLGYTF
ncbi:MAG TPA: hypothetical protein VM553_13425 [Dongiaceae bacterium]|nr:hypothetical protein [Dongiaceae bacterium]